MSKPRIAFAQWHLRTNGHAQRRHRPAGSDIPVRFEEPSSLWKRRLEKPVAALSTRALDRARSLLETNGRGSKRKERGVKSAALFPHPNLLVLPPHRHMLAPMG